MSTLEALAEFVTARLDEAAAGAWSVHDVARCDALLYEEDLADAAARTPDCDCGYPARVRRDVEAKRDHLATYLAAAEAARTDDTRWRAGEVFALRAVVERDAEIWNDHPDYRPGWVPA